MVTLRDVAKAAGVSVSSVSKALRNGADINKETAKRIREVAKKLNYKIKSEPVDQDVFNRFVGIICPEVRSNFYSQVVTQITELLAQNNIGVMLCFTNFSVEREIYYLKLLYDKKAAGVFCLTEDPTSARQLSALPQFKNIPVIQVGINVDANECDNIFVDEMAGLDLAVEHLVSLGHKKIAFIGDTFARIRLDYFIKAMAKQGVEVKQDFLCLSYERFERCGYEQMEKLLSMEERPTAIITQYDEIAVGAMRSLYERGVRVPQDMSVIGMENVTFGAYLKDGLTTIVGHVEEMGRIAVDLLMHKIDDSDFNVVQRIQLIPTLFVRETTAKACITQ